MQRRSQMQSRKRQLRRNAERYLSVSDSTKYWDKQLKNNPNMTKEELRILLRSLYSQLTNDDDDEDDAPAPPPNQ